MTPLGMFVVCLIGLTLAILIYLLVDYVAYEVGDMVDTGDDWP